MLSINKVVCMYVCMSVSECEISLDWDLGEDDDSASLISWSDGLR